VQNGVVNFRQRRCVAAKFSADQKAHHVKGVTAVRNDIQVNAGSEVSDQHCRQNCRSPSTMTWSVTHHGLRSIGFRCMTARRAQWSRLRPVDAPMLSPSSRHQRRSRCLNNIEIDPVSPMDDRSPGCFPQGVQLPHAEPVRNGSGEAIRIQVATGTSPFTAPSTPRRKGMQPASRPILSPCLQRD